MWYRHVVSGVVLACGTGGGGVPGARVPVPLHPGTHTAAAACPAGVSSCPNTDRLSAGSGSPGFFFLTPGSALSPFGHTRGHTHDPLTRFLSFPSKPCPGCGPVGYFPSTTSGSGNYTVFYVLGHEIPSFHQF